MGAPHRNEMMDGLRGWAAVSVAGYHFVWETFGARYPELRTPVTSFFFNGAFAVSIYFVLSGYVLTAQDWLDPDKTRTLRQMLKRYTRLMLPVLAASTIVFLLMALHLTFNVAAGRVVGREEWLGRVLGFAPSLEGVVAFSTGGVFLPVEHGVDYGPFLWTMAVELWGSFLVLLLCLCERRLGRPEVVLSFAGLCLFSLTLLSGFFFGALIAYVHRRGGLAFRQPGRRRGVTVAVVIAACVLLAGLATWSGATDLWGGVVQRRNVLCAVLAAILVLAASSSAWIWDLLSSPLSLWLGRISFPIYLMQFPVLVSPTSAAIILADNAGILNLPVALIIAAGSLALTLAAAAAFLPVEWGTAWVGRQLGRLIPGRAVPSAARTAEVT
jgi:peptidoglycan/LPS O-acetylase OafA/YrhL